MVCRVQVIAINPYRAGDYFVYFDKPKLAMFQVSEACERDLEEVLNVQGIRSQAIVRRKEREIPRTYENPPNMPEAVRKPEFLDRLLTTVGVGANIITVGATLAGLASCTVM